MSQALALDEPPATAEPRPFSWSGWASAAAVAALVVVLWLASGVSGRDVAAFSAYLVLGLALPGSLVWRRLAGELSRPFALDVVAGLVVGYAVELVVYLLAETAGVPWLTPAWSVAVIALTLAVPAWRPLWRARGFQPMPAAWSWAMAALVAFTVLWYAHQFWWHYPVSFPALSRTYSDEQYALALVGEARHHLPPSVPWVAGEPLKYHWYVYGHLAASSWVTGIEPVVLLRRLALTPMVIVPVVGAAIAAVQVTRRIWAGPVCAAVLVAVGPVHSGWMATTLPYGQLYTDLGLALSATAVYGTAVFAPALVMVLRILDPDEPTVHWPFWVGLAGMLGLLAGAKSTFLPLVFVALIAVVGLQLLVRRRVDRSAVGLLLLAAGWLLFAQVVVFGGGSAGIKLAPFDAGQHGRRTLKTVGLDHLQLTAALLVGAVLIAMLAKAVAALALIPDRGWADSRAVFLLVFSAAGLAAYGLLGHFSLSEAAFAKATALPLCVAAAWGLCRLGSWVVPRRLAVTTTAWCVPLGAAITAVIWTFWPHVGPFETGVRVRDLVAPQVLIVLTVTLAAVAGALVVRRLRWSTTLAAWAVCCALLGSGALFAVGTVVHVSSGWGAPRSILPRAIGPGGIEAARWVRAHAAPGDVLATNEHLSSTGSNRVFWLAANAERRVLVEGWGYTERISSRYGALRSLAAPFWDPAKLRINDAAFDAPSRRTVNRLARKYGVRWLFLNRRLSRHGDELARFATLRYSRGDYSVYEIPAKGGSGVE